MAILGVDDFKSKLTGGGARSNLFKVEMGWPAGIAAGAAESEIGGFLIKGAALPGSTITPITVPFQDVSSKLLEIVHLSLGQLL